VQAQIKKNRDALTKDTAQQTILMTFSSAVVKMSEVQTFSSAVSD
jgi:hypothetical protein